jgi:mannose-6-phosphate isomerase-like protein (cupin superfamily)
MEIRSDAPVVDAAVAGVPPVPQPTAESFRPWGSFCSLLQSPGFQVKRLTVRPGGVLSLQSHRHRAEHWTVVQGVAEVTCGEAVFELGVNQSTHIPLGAVHRLANRGTETLYVIEVQCGDYLGEDDIVRYADDYGRTDRANGPAAAE